MIGERDHGHRVAATTGDRQAGQAAVATTAAVVVATAAAVEIAVAAREAVAVPGIPGPDSGASKLLIQSAAIIMKIGRWIQFHRPESFKHKDTNHEGSAT